MSAKQDGRKLWLEENITYANKFLNQLMDASEKRKLSPSEEKLKHVSASYCYLYNILLDSGLLEDSDDYNDIFPPETIH
jgi:hypothetical protein